MVTPTGVIHVLPAIRYVLHCVVDENQEAERPHPSPLRHARSERLQGEGALLITHCLVTSGQETNQPGYPV